MAKKNSYVGIDLGGSSLKVIELKNVGNRPQLVTYGLINETYNIIKDESKQALDALAEHLKELLASSKVTSDRVVSALPSYSVFSSIISLPAMSKKDLVSAVRWEAKKFVPIPLEEMILDWELLEEDKSKPGEDLKADKEKNEKLVKDTDKKEGKEVKDDKVSKDEEKLKVSFGAKTAAKGNIKVLLTAAPKNLVNRYVELFKKVNLQLVGLETESFALERSLIGNDKNPIMVIDVGSSATSIIIFSGGVPILNRSIDIGGKNVTKSIVETMGISEEQAEQFKRDMGVSIKEDTVEKLPQPIRFVVNSIINEIRYILNIYKSQNRQPIAKVIFTGGSSYLANISDNIQTIFNIKSYIGDPWARVIHPIEIDEMLKEFGPRMSVAIGLAMREIEK